MMIQANVVFLKVDMLQSPDYATLMEINKFQNLVMKTFGWEKVLVI